MGRMDTYQKPTPLGYVVSSGLEQTQRRRIMSGTEPMARAAVVTISVMMDGF